MPKGEKLKMTKQELASKIWKAANALRAKIKANEYKDYILGFMFYKYLSDQEEKYVEKEGGTIEDLKGLEDESDTIKDDIGYFISYDDLFSNWLNKGIELGASTVTDALDNFNKNIHSNNKKSFENIFSTLRNGLSKLGDSSGSRDKAVRDIVHLIADIPTTDDNYDVMGYIYEFLIYKFSTAAKEDGAFYTPHEVSSLISQIIAHNMKDRDSLSVYDPTSGSGSLLLNIGQETGKHINKDYIKYYGQEKITETYHLTRMNLIMKGINVSNIFIRNGDTLEDDWPYFDEETNYEPLYVDAVVSNPPYSLKWNPDERESDARFKYGLAPSSKADYAFLQHCLYHLKNDGIMAIVLPHGVLFRGDSEYEIRKNLIKNNHIETIIGLPANLFYATSIPTIIMILRKNRENNDIQFVDASQNFVKEGKNNVLRECDVKRILDAVIERKDITNYSRLVSFEEIKNNDYNLNIPRYVTAKKEADICDFAALMNGTVLNQELDKYMLTWTEFSSLRNELYHDLGNGYSEFCNVNIKETVNANKDVLEFINGFNNIIDEFKEFLNDTLIINYSDNIDMQKDKIVEKLFAIAKKYPIIDKYDIYQLFINEWNGIETDICLIKQDKLTCRNTEPNMIMKKVNKEEKEVQDGYKGTIIPFDIVGNAFFTNEYSRLKLLKYENQNMEFENMDIYESLEEDVKNATGNGEKFTEAILKKYIKNEADDAIKEDLQKALNNILEMKTVKKEIKSIESTILDKIKDKIENLTDDEIDIMLSEKWINPLCDEIKAITRQIIRNFIKINEDIKKKYGKTLKQIDEEIKEKDEHLKDLLGQLTGSDIDIKAIEDLRNIL